MRYPWIMKYILPFSKLPRSLAKIFAVAAEVVVAEKGRA